MAKRARPGVLRRSQCHLGSPLETLINRAPNNDSAVVTCIMRKSHFCAVRITQVLYGLERCLNNRSFGCNRAGYLSTILDTPFEIHQTRNHPGTTSLLWMLLFVPPNGSYIENHTLQKRYLGTWNMQTTRTPKCWAEFNTAELYGIRHRISTSSNYWREPNPGLAEQLFYSSALRQFQQNYGPGNGDTETDRTHPSKFIMNLEEVYQRQHPNIMKVFCFSSCWSQRSATRAWVIPRRINYPFRKTAAQRSVWSNFPTIFAADRD